MNKTLVKISEGKVTFEGDKVFMRNGEVYASVNTRGGGNVAMNVFDGTKEVEYFIERNGMWYVAESDSSAGHQVTDDSDMILVDAIMNNINI